MPRATEHVRNKVFVQKKVKEAQAKPEARVLTEVRDLGCQYEPTRDNDGQGVSESCISSRGARNTASTM
jgi:hypothetical protein